jgi:sulfite dehydrogenase (cytochrome) subunit B
MKFRMQIPVGVVGTLATAAALTAAAADVWKLPAEKMVLKPGKGREVVIGQCTLCHSVDYLTTQPPLTRAGWTASVDKMRSKYGAPIPTNAIPVLVDYLVVQYGKADPQP